MTLRGCSIVSLAVAASAAPALACQTVVPCVPSACIQMHPAYQNLVNGRGSTRLGGGGAPAGGFNSLNVNLLSNLPLGQMGGGSGSSLYAWVDPLTNKEYALMGRSNGTAVIDVTNPAQPRYVANVPAIPGSTPQLWREPKTYQNHMYIGVDGTTHRMQIVDLTQVRNYSGTTMTLNYGSYASNVTRIHTLAINPQSGYLYASGTGLNSGAPHIIDVRNPANPVAAGNVPGGAGWDGYSHESQVVIYNGPDVAHRGKEIMVSSNGKSPGTGDTLSVVNVTNKSAPVRLSSRTYPNAGYIHQGWLTEDHRYFFENDELDSTPNTRTHLWDLADLDNPVYRGFWDNTTVATDHNLYVKDGFVYQTNYTTGLRILKIGDLSSTNSSQWLTEVAYFDTYAPNDAPSPPWAGAWNNYPYLPSGNILVSDINGGLFVLRANLPQPPQPPGPIPLPKGGGWGTVPEPASALAAVSLGFLVAARRKRY